MSKSAASVRFGSFEFDSQQRRLKHGVTDLHLTPKAFDLLEILIRAAPRVVRKAEIHDRLWPRGLVSDATLVGLVKELRRALDDHDAATPIIRTVHRVGYSFCPAVAPDGVPAVGAVCGWLVSSERRLALASGENLVGRDPSAQVWLDHATVSRRHARIMAEVGGAVLEDLGSKNGTRVDERLLDGSAVLHDGARVVFGDIPLTYRTAQGNQVTATQITRKNPL